MEGSSHSIDDIEHGKLFWNSHSFEEYAMQCDINGIQRLFDKEQFESLHVILSKSTRV